MHPQAANRLYFAWLLLNYFFSGWFSVGAPPTLGSELPTTINNMKGYGGRMVEHA